MNAFRNESFTHGAEQKNSDEIILVLKLTEHLGRLEVSARFQQIRGSWNVLSAPDKV